MNMVNNTKTVFAAAAAQVSDSARIITDPTGQSRYEQVLYFENTKAEFTLQIEEQGSYELIFSYYAPLGDLCQFMYVNGTRYKIGFNKCFQGWQQISYLIPLNHGENTITLYSMGVEQDCESGEIYIESIALQTYNSFSAERIYTLPCVYPRVNYLYSSLTHRLEYTVMDPATLLSVKIDEQTVPFTVDKTVMTDGELHFFNQENIILDLSAVTGLAFGKHTVSFDYGENTAYSELIYCEAPATSAMTINYIDVGHGCSVFIRFPDQTNMLIDTGYDYMTQERVIPFLQANGVTALDYYITTHYDSDHVGGKAQIEQHFEVKQYCDCHSFHIGDKVIFGETSWEILNAYVSGDDLNENSLSFRLEYNGFVYVHGSDIYAENQRAIEQHTPQSIRCHVYHGNHHFFGSLDPYYLRKTNPYLFIMGVNVHCYSKSAHVNHFLKAVEDYLKSHQGRLIETIRGYQSGNATLRINSAEDFTYETYRENHENRNL